MDESLQQTKSKDSGFLITFIWQNFNSFTNIRKSGILMCICVINYLTLHCNVDASISLWLGTWDSDC